MASAELAPAGIILDAELTLATPERLWLSTGLRALDHAVGEHSGLTGYICVLISIRRESLQADHSDPD